MDKDRELELLQEAAAVARRCEWGVTSPIDAEDWYRRAVEFYRYDIEKAAGKPIPEFHISSGFTHAGVRRTRTAGQCWSPTASADKRAQIFLNPRFTEPTELINTIVHEVIHATVGVAEGHFRPFSKVAAACGMRRPWKATRWTVEGMEKATFIAEHCLGPFPRAAFTGQRHPGSRLLKAVCPKCGCKIRITQLWADRGMPSCGGRRCGGSEFELAD